MVSAAPNLRFNEMTLVPSAKSTAAHRRRSDASATVGHSKPTVARLVRHWAAAVDQPVANGYLSVYRLSAAAALAVSARSLPLGELARVRAVRN
jgi:hypothetical protein